MKIISLVVSLCFAFICTTASPQGSTQIDPRSRINWGVVGTTVNLFTNPLVEELVNNSSSGATLDKLVCINASAQAQTCTTSSIMWSGVAVGGATGTTTGYTQIARLGEVDLILDGTGVIGDYVQISTGIGGDGHDAGSTYPTSGAIIGRVTTANSGAGTAAVVNLYGPGIAGVAGSTGISGGVVGGVLVATGASTGVSSFQRVDLTVMSGSTLDQKIASCLSALNSYYGTYAGVCDGRGLKGAQALSANAFAAIATSTGSTPVTVFLPETGVTVTATQTWTSNDVQVIQDGLTGQSDLLCGTGFNGPVFSIGSTSGTFRTTLHVRMQSEGNCTGTMLSLTGVQEGTKVDGTSIIGGNSATTTAPIVICTSCGNFDMTGLNVSQAGNNYAVEFITANDNTTQGITITQGTGNNTNYNSGLACLYFPTSPFTSQIEVINPHCEGFTSGIEVGNNISVAVHGMVTTGTITVQTIKVDAGGSTGGIWADNICDLGTATYLVNDLRNAISVTTAGNPFAGHSCMSVYTVGGGIARGTLTMTTAVSDTATILGVTSASNCSLTPTNKTAATNLTSTYVSTVAPNSVTVSHPATSDNGGTLSILCSPN